MVGPRPPRLARWLVSKVAVPSHRSVVLGDLEEEYAGRIEAGVEAWLWYWGQVLRSLGPLMAMRLGGRSRDVPGHRSARASKGDGPMHEFARDIRWTLRSWRRAPGLALGVVVTLALGIGASTVVFSLVDGTILQTLPVPEPGRLVGIGSELPRAGRDLSYFENLTPAEYMLLRDESQSLEAVVSWDMGNRQVNIGEAVENLFSGFWWGDGLATLGVDAWLGRGMTAQETTDGSAVALLSHRVWVSRFGADSTLVGGTIRINDAPYTLIGILPPGVVIYGMDLWMPMGIGPEVFGLDRRQWQVMARIAPGVTMEGVQSELDLFADRMAREHGAELPEYAGWRMVPDTWSAINNRTFRPAALLLSAAVVFVLLLVCVNVANLLLVRSATRRREFAVRTALGAGSGRIVRQVLVESLVLALVGAGVGVVLGALGLRAVLEMVAATGVTQLDGITMNARVLAFTGAVAVLAGLAFGAAPALYALRADLRAMLQSDGGGGLHAIRLRSQRVFVAIEVALAMVLLAGSGLLVHSFVRLQAVDPGFDTDNLLTMRLTLARERYTPDQVEPFFRELVGRLEGVPGVVSAAATIQLPTGGFSRGQFWIEGQELGTEATLPTAFQTLASPEYFETMGIPVLRGRSFDATDALQTPLVGVINEAAADRYFPGIDPIGKRIKPGGPDSDGPWLEIVGIVGSVHNRGAQLPPDAELFASTRQIIGANNQFFVVMRTRVEPRSVLPAVRAAVAEIDPLQPIYLISTAEEAMAASTLTYRISTIAMTVFALFAVLLAAIGIYGVIAFGVAQRTREIGLRVALGARAGQVRALVVRQLAIPLVVGAIAGIAAALAMGRLLAGLLFEIAPNDPATLTIVVILLLAIAAVAAFLPAKRATRLDPLQALRDAPGIGKS